jgi:radical SAM superfamily enzyme YgiQ (UPF0313 family)
MKILLINPPIRLSEKPTDFPVGLGLLAAIMLQEGHDVLVYDANALRPAKTDMMRDIAKFKGVDIIGVGGLITTYRTIKSMIPELRESFPNAKIILGGGVTVDPEIIFKNMPVDFCVHREAERTFPELCAAINEHRNEFSPIAGISYPDKDQGHIVITPPRPLERNLDQFPMPAYALFPTEIYMQNNSFRTVHPDLTNESKRCATLMWSRGCSSQCTFCWRMAGRTWRFRSANLLMDEIRFLRSNYGVDSYLFIDECINASRKHAIEFATQLIDSGLAAPWYSHARVNSFDADLARVFSQSGCVGLNFGIESGSPKILAEMKKRQSPDQASKAVQIALKADIRPCCTFIIGMPGETEATVQESVNWIRENKIWNYSFFFATPYPDCELYSQPEVQKRILEKYCTKDAFFSVLGDAVNLIINLTSFTDEQLLALQEEATGKARHSLWQRLYRLATHPHLWPIVLRGRVKRVWESLWPRLSGS